MRKFFWLFLVLILVVALVIGYYTDNIPFLTRQAGPAATPEPVTGGQSSTASVGAELGFGQLGYRVSQVQKADGLQYAQKNLTPGGSYVLVYLTVSNNGKQPTTMTASDFGLADKQGRTYTVDTDATDVACLQFQKARLLGVDVQPGLSRESVLVFDAPKDASGLSFRLFQGYIDVQLGQ